MILKIFVHPNCSNCPPAKVLGKKLGVKNKDLKIEEYDVITVDGMAEGAFYQVMGTPTMLLTDDQGKIIREWRGKVPTEKEIILKLKS